MSEFLVVPQLDLFFADLVADAERSVGAQLPAGASTYLAGLLADFATRNDARDAMMAGSLTLQLHASMSMQSAHDRFVQLRALGDSALYMGGFFSEHFRARGVNDTYVRAIGRSAYTHAGHILRAGGGPAGSDGAPRFDLFETLASAFDGLARVLERVACTLLGAGLATASNALRAYEYWLRTDDAELAKMLAAMGMTPPAKA